jgi:hypothetical protein
LQRDVLGERYGIAVGEPQPLATLPAELEAIAPTASGVDRDVKARFAVPRAGGEVSCPKAPRGGGEVSRFEQARLAGAVAAQQQVPPLAGGEGGVGEVAERAGG